MSPYYERDGITVWHGDAVDLLPQLPNVDLVLTDPPYSARTHSGARTNRASHRGRPLLDFDSMTASDITEVFALCAARLRGWLLSFLDWKHLAQLEQRPPAGLKFVRFGVWVKPNGAPQLSGDRPGMGWEAIGIFHTDGERLSWNGGGHHAVWTFMREPHPVHTAQKPLPLVKQLAALFSSPGQTIMDPFMGSGTTLRAAKDVGCKAIGIEREERFCEIAANRLRQEVLFI